MGKAKKTETKEKPKNTKYADPKALASPTADAKKQMQDMQLQYTQNISQIQQQSSQAYDQVNQSSQAAIAALQKQLEQSDADRQNYANTLQEYLRNLATMQQQYNQQLAQRDAVVKQEQNLKTNETNANNMMNNLLAASTVASQKFANNTRRKGVIA